MRVSTTALFTQILLEDSTFAHQLLMEKIGLHSVDFQVFLHILPCGTYVLFLTQFPLIADYSS